VVELLEALAQGRCDELRKVAGLSWVEADTRRIIHNADRPFITDLDQVADPLREVNWIDGDRVRRGIETDFPVTTTRGCPFKCKFCDVGLITGHKFRRRSVEAVFNEVERLVADVDPYKIIFTDDLINFDRHRLLDMAAEVERRDLRTEYWVMGRADLLVAHPETADAMGRMGVSTMFLGIESPHRHVLEAYGKGRKASAETSGEAVRLLRESGVETWGAFMLGELSETKEDMQATIDFARDLNPETAQFTVLTPYPGTALWNEARDRIFTRNWDLFDCMHSVVRSDHAEPAEIDELCRDAYLKFYLRPRRLFQRKLRKQHGSRPDLRTVVRIVRGMKALFGGASRPSYASSPLAVGGSS
jgi:anaerobic magnesium-protoporphyrin IX monomethyl ester cyclase